MGAPPPGKSRLDALIHARGLAPSRAKAAALIRAGDVVVAGRRLDKPGTLVDASADLRLKARATRPFVSRGGGKLQGALTDLGLDVAGLVCADIGASTGGFTDVLLRRGAAHVYAIDVGKGLLHQTLRTDPRVSVLEGFNARHLAPAVLPAAPDFAVMDVSFIGAAKVLPALTQCLKPTARLLVMVKPQFELGPGGAPKGVVRDGAARSRAADQVAQAAAALGWRQIGRCDSRLPGPKGNVEIFVLFARG